ncbi:MAG TPA: hypothetical protein VGA95_12980, partial [Thermodesulfobacteriota bacterium]
EYRNEVTVPFPKKEVKKCPVYYPKDGSITVFHELMHAFFYYNSTGRFIDSTTEEELLIHAISDGCSSFKTTI